MDVRRRKVALRVLMVVLMAVVVWALAGVLRRDGPAALEAWRQATVSWPWVVAATLSGLAGHAVYTWGWHRVLHDLGVRSSFWDLMRIFLVSNLGRYLPAGKAWQMGIVGVMASERGLPAAVLAGTSLLQGMIGVAVGAVVLMATGGAALGLSPLWYVLIGASLVALLFTPVILRAWPALRALVVKRLPTIDDVSVGTMWALIWTSAATWVAWGVALWALARALLGDPVAPVVTYVAAWTGPFIAGLIAIMTPAGLGVRDGVMQSMLSAAGVPAGGALVLAVVARVWATLVEVVPAVVLLAIRKRRGSPAEAQPAVGES